MHSIICSGIHSTTGNNSGCLHDWNYSGWPFNKFAFNLIV